MRWLAFLAFLFVTWCGGAHAASPSTVFIGGTGKHFAELADPAVAGPLRATGRIGLYQHAVGVGALSAAQRSALWTAWGLSAFGEGDTVAELGGGPSPQFMLFTAGHVPAEVDTNEDAVGRSRYTARAGDAHPGQEYRVYTSEADAAELKAHIDFYRSHGARSVGVVVTPNAPGVDFDDPFPTGAFWAHVRAVATYGGAIAIDTPPSYARFRGVPYQANAAEMIAWGNAQGLRTSVIVSPYSVAAIQGGRPNCVFDPDFARSTRLFVMFLELRNALPSQWVVENYCPDGTPNDIDPAGGPDGLNAVALYLATLPRHP